ncbi:slipin family protein [Pedosphaera parvula]|uniref:Band 7 protein n=1 Tax=Pedosphaera parvula (strain Ellin514) TaxID=320771 RepID=B9XDQ2_PEDPL|nr:slipin family protein [Pedosphaera parvula]EEF62198.1 band 7 protein [Pedosphaera parvula Ellin514]
MMENIFWTIALAAAIVVPLIVASRWTVFTVSEGFYGLLYYNGKSWHRISPGKHRFWKSGYTVQLVDMRKTILTVAGQEVLSAENVGLKVSAVLTYQIIECETAMHTVQDYVASLYNATQLALRSVIAGQSIEALLDKRLDIGKELLALVKLEAEKLGIEVHAVEVKDVMFPSELKKAFSEVLRAQKEGQAALERARCETAALRNLANAARLMEGNPALMNLRLMQSIGAAGTTGNTLVMGMLGGFVPMKNGNGKAESDHKKSSEEN